MATNRTGTAHPTGIEKLVSFFANLLMLVIGLTILTLLLYRFLWMRGLWLGTFNPEGAEEYHISRLVLTTGDPAVVPCLIVLTLVALTFALLPAHSAPKRVPRLSLALKVLAVYSVIMIVEQIWFIAIARVRLNLPSNLILNGTYLTLDDGPQDGGKVLLQFYDPHYYTLGAALLGLALYWAPAFVNKVWRYISNFWPPRP